LWQYHSRYPKLPRGRAVSQPASRQPAGDLPHKAKQGRPTPTNRNLPALAFPLSPDKVRLALLNEGGHPLLLVLRREQVVEEPPLHL
jgi:hypothetical protein